MLLVPSTGPHEDMEKHPESEDTTKRGIQRCNKSETEIHCGPLGYLPPSRPLLRSISESQVISILFLSLYSPRI